MGDSLSATLSDIWMVKIEQNIVILHKPIFYKSYVDDIINRRKKHEENLFFKKLNKYHPKTKLTTKFNPPKFLDTEIIIVNNEVLQLYIESKLTVSWESKFPEHSKGNTISGELHHVKKTSSNFQKEVKGIKETFIKANSPLTFINSVIAQFNNNRYNNNETNFTIEKFLNRLLDGRPEHPTCKIYKGICSCESTYVREAKQNVEIRYSEHNHPSRKSEPSKHLNQNIIHVFTCSIICSTLKFDRTIEHFI